ncbi:MAG: uL15 family ribosomal protein, partial [Gammaproteobacteria bacterium]
GGQMPLQRRLPKVGFRSHIKLSRAQVRLDALTRVDAEVIDILALKAAGLVPLQTDKVKVILAGELKKKVALKGVHVTKGAKAAIEAAGGKVED